MLTPSYPCRAPSSRRSVVPSHASFDWCGSVPLPDVVGMSSGAVMLYRASSRPPRLSSVVCGELVKTARAEMTFSLPPPFRFPAICVSPRPALLPACRVVRRGGMISQFSLLACSVMSSWPWRCRLIRGDLPCVCLLVLASTSASRLSSRSSLSSLARPACSCRGAGSLGVGVHCCPPWSASCRRRRVLRCVAHCFGLMRRRERW